MIDDFNSFSEEYLLESAINESIIYFSPRMREHLSRVNSDISKRLLELEGEDIPKFDATFFDVDENSNVTFITMQNAIKLIGSKYSSDLDTYSKDDFDALYYLDVADQHGTGIYKRSRNSDQHGTGIYKRSRNSIKIGKLANILLKGTLRSNDLEKFVNDFKASGLSEIEKIELVSGDEIKKWYEKSINKGGTLGNSCMSGKDSRFFNIYSENPDSCRLLIMTIDGDLVARALVWKLNSIKSDTITGKKPEFFLDRVYSIEDYQVQKIRRYALDMGWSIKKSNYERGISWNGAYHTDVRMSVKVKKSNYGNVFPYMDTFSRYDRIRGLLWNDTDWSKGGKLLNSTRGTYTRGAPLPLVYINRFRDFFRS